MAEIAKGTVFGGRYVVQAQVGTGGMATVYRGVDNVLDRQVAIKVMLPQYANDPTFAQRFKQEAQAAASLQSPYIVQVYDWGRDVNSGTYYIVMEYLRGTDLKTGIRSHGTVPLRKVAQIGAQVCSALSVAHAHDIIHRDIKPQNIMILPNGDAKVMDFGIAQAKNSHLTQTNSVLGTARYVSPEQARGEQLEATSDLYSLGIVMYEAATGTLPFDGEDAVSVALKQVNEQPVPPSLINPNVDEAFESIVMRCLSKDPRARYQSADELRQVLNRYIKGEPIGMPVALGASMGYGPETTTVQPVSPSLATVRPSNTGPTRTVTQPMVRATNGRAAGTNNPFIDRQRDNLERKRGRGGNGALVVAIVVAAIALIALAVVLGLQSCNKPGGNNPSNPVTPVSPVSPSGQGSGTTVTPSSPDAALATVPSLTNYTQQEATNKLATEGLVLGSVTPQKSETVAAGKIITQTPTSGSKVAKGSAVSVVVSSGSDRVSVPDLRGYSLNDALSLLTGQGLTGLHDPSLDTYSPDIPEGLVATFSPANQNVTRGTAISIGMSLGVDPATFKTTVPNVIDWLSADAEYAMTEAELNFTEVRGPEDAFAADHVTYVSPEVGQQIDKWSTVTIYISTGPTPVQLREYAGWSLDAAKDDLSGLKLNIYAVTDRAATFAEEAHTVLYTDPGAGQVVERGTMVTLHVVGDYVEPLPVLPSVAGMSAYDAYDALYGAGFKLVSIVDGSGASVDAGDLNDRSATGASMGADAFSAVLAVTNKVTPEPEPEPPTPPAEGSETTPEEAK